MYAYIYMYITCICVHNLNEVTAMSFQKATLESHRLSYKSPTVRYVKPALNCWSWESKRNSS